MIQFKNGIKCIVIGSIPKSIKTTSVKPSGTVSLLAGHSGLHYPESRFYTRRIRVSKHSELLEPMVKDIK